MIFEETGIVRAVLHDQTKSGKSITTVVIERAAPSWMAERGTETERIPFKAFAKAANEATALQEGDEVVVKFRTSGREWQGKWFGEMVAEKFVKTGKTFSGRPSQPPQDEPQEAGDLPF